MQILLDSYCFRCLRTCLRVFQEVYNGSKLKLGIDFIKRIWSGSYFGKLNHWYEQKEPLFEKSTICNWFSETCTAIRKKVEEKIPLFRMSDKQQYEIFTYVLAMYAFVEFVFRTYIVRFSSVWDELFLIFAFMVWAYKGMSKGEKSVWRNTPLSMCALFFCGAFGVLMFVSSNFQIALEGFRVIAQYVIWIFAVIQLLKDEYSVKNLLSIFVCTTGILGAHGVWQYITKVEMPETWVESSESVRTRVFSIFTSPNIFGSLLVLAIPIGVAMIFVAKSVRHKMIYGILSIAMLGALVFTYSRGAWLGLCVAIGVYVLLKDKRMILAAVGLGVGVLLFVPSISNRFLFMFSSEYLASSMRGGRLIRWLTALDILKEHPLVGLGLGHFGGAVAINHKLSAVVNGQIVNTFYMDNYYLKIASEAGLIGLGLFVWLMYQVFVISIKTIGITKERHMKELEIGILAGLSGVMFHNLVENVFEVPMMSTLFWMLAGVMMYLWYINYYKIIGGYQNVEN